MALRVARVKKVKWPVSVSIPQDGGTVKIHKFTAEFELPTQKEHDELLRAGEDLQARVFVGGEDLQDTNGEPAEYSEALKAELLETSYIRAALNGAFYEAFYGRKAERKNV